MFHSVRIFQVIRWLLPGFALLAAGCSITSLGNKELIPVSGQTLRLRELTEEEHSGDLGVKDQFPEYKRDALSPDSRIFLIAGGAQSPDYLQEIVDQREQLVRMGHQPSEIVCYYVKPSAAQYQEFRERFDQLAGKTEGFCLAAPHLIYRHLRAAASASPDFVYLYASGEGHEPIWIDDAKGAERELAKYHADYFGQYRLELEGGPSGHMNPRMRLEALRDGIPIGQLLFTPRYLIQALNAFPEETLKFVILQGAYSGGFVRNDFEQLEADTLSEVPNITVLTSTRHDREGFRGEPGDDTHTCFGDAYLKALSKRDNSLLKLEWPQVAGEVISSVRQHEEVLSVTEEEASKPVFYSSTGEPELIVEVAPEGVEVADIIKRGADAEEQIAPAD